MALIRLHVSKCFSKYQKALTDWRVCAQKTHSEICVVKPHLVAKVMIQFFTLLKLVSSLQKTLKGKILQFAKGTNDAAETNCPTCSHKTSYQLSHLPPLLREMVGGKVKGAREMGRGEGQLVRPPGRGMLSTLHPGKGSLRSSGPICSRRGK